MNAETPKKIKVKAYSPGELAEIYEVDRRTLKRWLAPFAEDIGNRRGRYYTIWQVKKIFEKLSLPGSVVVKVR